MEIASKHLLEALELCDKSPFHFIYDQENLCFPMPNKFLVSRSKTDHKLLAIQYISYKRVSEQQLYYVIKRL